MRQAPLLIALCAVLAAAPARSEETVKPADALAALTQDDMREDFDQAIGFIQAFAVHRDLNALRLGIDYDARYAALPSKLDARTTPCEYGDPFLEKHDPLLRFVADEAAESPAHAAPREQISQWMESSGFSGAIRLGRGPDVLVELSAGRLSADDPQVPDMSTRFHLASVSKLFTAMVVRDLLAASDFSLNTPLSQVLPKFARLDPANPITLVELLSHRSGLPMFGDFGGGDLQSLDSDEAYFALLDKLSAVQDKPAEGQAAYSNAGYLVLGEVIASLSGGSYESAVKARIFEPLGMLSSGWLSRASLPANTARAMRRSESGWTDVSTQMPPRGSSAGGAYSSVDDLSRLVQSVLKQAADPEFFADLMQTRAMLDDPVETGAGFDSIELSSGRWYGHTGLAPGTNTLLMVQPESGYWVIALANTNVALDDFVLGLADSLQ